MFANSFAKGLRAAGLAHDFEEFYWSQGMLLAPIFADLWNTKHHQRQADRLADRIREYTSEHPGLPVHLVTHSGGAAMGVFALERLSDNQAVTSLVMVNAGLSPWYDLSPALQRCTVGMLSLSSWLDWFILGIAITLVGTMDRWHCPAAGMVGFRVPKEKTGVYTRLHQVYWSPSYIWKRGWFGMHVSAGGHRFVKETIGGWIKRAETSTS